MPIVKNRPAAASGTAPTRPRRSARTAPHPAMAAPAPASSSELPEVSKEQLFALIERDLYTLEQISKKTNLPNATLTIYHGRGSMPKPDYYIGRRTPFWHHTSIDDWIAARAAKKAIQ